MDRIVLRKVGSGLQPVDIVTADFIKRLDPGQTVYLQERPKKRSLDQNAGIHVIYGEVASQWDGMTTEDVKHHCKLYHGVPILRRDDRDFCEWYDTHIKAMDIEAKLMAMRYIPVTRNFTKKQAGEYMELCMKDFDQMGFTVFLDRQTA